MATLRPEDFGPLGNPADDTAALTTLAATAQSGDIIELSGHLRVDGEIAFSGQHRLSVVGRALVQQIGQQKKTLAFRQFGSVDVEGIHFEGRGGAAGEYTPTSSGYNQVSALFFDEGGRVSIDKIACREHAGGDVNFRNVKSTRVHGSAFEGIGSDYINPIDNGGDFAISAQSWTHKPMSMDYSHDWSHNSMKGHAFGVQAVGTKSFIFQGNEVSCEGQHGVYGIELDGMNIAGNSFYGCPQLAIKMQHENYAATFYGTPWTPGTFMAVGVEKVYLGHLYLCISSHTSSTVSMDTDYYASRWVLSPRMFRKGGMITGNYAQDCGSVVGIISSSLSDKKEEYIDGLTISNNSGVNCLADGYVLDRCVNVDFLNNRVEKAGRYGVLARNSSGRFNGNRVSKSTHSGMMMALSHDSEIRQNQLIDTGLGAAGIEDKYPIYVAGMNPATQLPFQSANPTIVFDANTIKYTTGDCASAQATFFDTRYKVDMTENRTNSAKPGRINGVKLRVRNNDFTSVI